MRSGILFGSRLTEIIFINNKKNLDATFMNKSLEERLEFVGEATELPPLPKNGVPSQWLPSWIRWPVRYLFLPFIWLDLFAQKIATLMIPPPFVKTGSCLKRGNCCHYILLHKQHRFLQAIHLFWSTQVNGFYLRSTESFFYEKKEVLVMGCRYLRKEGSCGKYHLRPLVCRQWPRINYFGKPQLLKGCGFKATPRDRLNILK